MGRPRKIVDIDGAEIEAPEAEQETVETMKNVPPVDLKNLKPCPKCGDKAKPPYLDKHGLWRCNCSHPNCGFWDSQVWESAEEAARSWQLAGGPNPRME